MNHLKSILQKIPTSPGVYLMKSSGNKVIYIGKAVNLKNRVRSYFNNTVTRNHLASHLLADKVANIDWVITDNEMEALILEANLVKKHKPRYNIMLKDDKHYPYLRLTVSEPFPRILVTRKIAKDGDLYFGPYTEVKAMRKTIKTMHKVFRIRDCNLKLPLKEKIKPCLTYHIGRCDAPCADLCSEEDYRKLAEEAALLLRGKNTLLIKNFENEMKEFSKLQNFEAAAKIRDQIKNIASVLQKQKMDLGEDNKSKDIIAVAREGAIGCAIVIQVRDGVVIDRKKFELTCRLEEDESHLITAFVKSFYSSDQEIPREMMLSAELLEEENIESLLKNMRKGAFDVEIPKRGDKKKQVKLAHANAKVQVAEYIAKKERRNRQNFSVTSLQEDLHLEIPPNRIEGFDISHLSGTDTVASMVVFVDGKPKKRDYRKFNIKTVEGIDDFASMYEVVSRRVRRILEENESLPDLFLIDGGKGQLGAASQALEDHGIENQQILGLAKRLEEVFLPGKKESVLIPKTSASLKLIQQLRDEAHRFAITFQKSKRKKYLTKSWLDEIPGIGPKLKEKLLKRFGSPALIKSASIKDLEEVVGPKLAQKIRS